MIKQVGTQGRESARPRLAKRMARQEQAWKSEAAAGRRRNSHAGRPRYDRAKGKLRGFLATDMGVETEGAGIAPGAFC